MCALDNINVLIRRDMIAMYVRVLGFKEGDATALYDDQQIIDLDSLRKLDDPMIKELCHAIGKEGHPVSMILQNRPPPQATCILGKAHVAHLARGG